MSVRNPLSLSTSGIMYRDQVSPVAYQQEEYEGSQSLAIDANVLSNSPRSLYCKC